MRHSRLDEGWRQLLLPNTVVEGNPKKRLMAACVKLYKDLLLLENFAIMNYCGFSKILKKHDRWTGFATKEKVTQQVARRARRRRRTLSPRLLISTTVYRVFPTLDGSADRRA